MRRGLLAWSKDEVPPEALAARVARCQAAMREAGLDALVAYTNFPRPAAVSWLTHFVPYWNQGVAVVPREGDPLLSIALSPRVHGWILSTCRVGEAMCTPRVGADAGAWIAEHVPGAKRIGVVERDTLPTPILAPLLAAVPGAEGVDATALFAGLRAPADAAEVALTRTAAGIAARALDAALAEAPATSAALAKTAEHAARLAAAEEVLILVAPDLGAGDALRRIEGEAALGQTYAVQLSLAYKGQWVRLARSVARGAAPASWAPAEVWLDARLAAMRAGATPFDAAPPAGIALESWSVERPLGTLPLAVESCSEGPSAPLAAGSVVSVSARLALADGAYVRAAPLIVGADAAERLTTG